MVAETRPATPSLRPHGGPCRSRRSRRARWHPCARSGLARPRMTGSSWAPGIRKPVWCSSTPWGHLSGPRRTRTASRIHSVRHTLALIMRRTGIPPVDAAALLGHTAEVHYATYSRAPRREPGPWPPGSEPLWRGRVTLVKLREIRGPPSRWRSAPTRPTGSGWRVNSRPLDTQIGRPWCRG
jgi:hypothetical protein